MLGPPADTRSGTEGSGFERGAERVAEILMWGLIDRPTGEITIRDHGCDALEAGYRALTGDAPLHGYRDHC